MMNREFSPIAQTGLFDWPSASATTTSKPRPRARRAGTVPRPSEPNVPDAPDGAAPDIAGEALDPQQQEVLDTLQSALAQGAILAAKRELTGS